MQPRFPGSQRGRGPAPCPWSRGRFGSSDESEGYPWGSLSQPLELSEQGGLVASQSRCSSHSPSTWHQAPWVPQRTQGRRRSNDLSTVVAKPNKKSLRSHRTEEVCRPCINDQGLVSRTELLKFNAKETTQFLKTIKRFG